MKLSHWLLVAGAALCAAAPVLIADLPAKYAALAPALLLVVKVVHEVLTQPAAQKGAP